MYINIGSNTLIRKKDIIGIFDLDTSSHEKDPRDFLKNAEKNGMDLPKSFVLVKKSKKEKGIRKNEQESKKCVYLTTLSSASLSGRSNKGL